MKLRKLSIVFGAMFGLLLFNFASVPSSFATTVVVFDDFEHGDPLGNGWFAFGSPTGGGGIDPNNSDLPPDGGAFSMQTGWGGAPGFYGGFGRTNPVDLTGTNTFSFWINPNAGQSYTIEINLQEDDNNDGNIAPADDDEFQFNCIVSPAGPCAVSGDGWQKVEIPLADFFDDGSFATGGNGVLDATPANGELINIVFAIIGDGAPAEFRTDNWTFDFVEPPVTSVVFDDMEHGDPFGNGWFTFGGGGIDPNTTDLPPADGGTYSLQTGWGGAPGFYGGFGRTNPLDLSGMDTFSFWINPNAGQSYTIEVNLQDDDNNDGNIAAADDDEFQFNCVVSPAGPCAVSGGGWQLVELPFADFFDDGSFAFGGNGVLDATPANGELINVVFAIIGDGGPAEFRTDYWAFSGSAGEPMQIVDDFESGLPTGVDGDGVPIGFFTFSDGSPISIATTDAPPEAVPGSAAGNHVMAMTGEVIAFAGFIHNFENDTIDTWVTQDWSPFEGVSFWFYGQNTGTAVFLDILDNRAPGSDRDDAERYTVDFIDDFTGWQLMEFPFGEFRPKPIGNGSPADGLTLVQMHGWALGTLNTVGEQTFYVDDFKLYGEAIIPDLAVTFSAGSFEIEEGTTGDITVKLNRAMNAEDPAEVSVDYFTEPGVAIPGREYAPTSGTLTFVNGGSSELTFPIETFDDSKWEGNERIVLRLSNPVDVEPGFAMQASAFIVENDNYDDNLIDDFERFPHLWESSDNVTLSNPELNSGGALARPEQDAIEGVLQVDGPIAVDIEIEGTLCKNGNGVIPVYLLTSDSFDALSVDPTSVTLGDATEIHGGGHAEDADGDGDIDLVFHFRASELGFDCEAEVVPFNGETLDGTPITAGGANATLFRDFPIGDDWSNGEALTFWYYGNNSGEGVTVNLKDNRAPDPGPAGWGLVWSEEFNEPAGTVPNPDNWTYEIGDVTPDGKNGWGNDERQYYTDDPANAATDGNGNMVLTLREDTSGRDCYYGTCEYTSARLISWRKAEFAYGRIESRIQVPQGAGIWPAFWSLGTDIDLVSWPQTGEIDFMEFVGRLPNEIFGTIHGPGYSGGQSFGNVYTFPEPVYNDYHTFTVEWEPDLIKWYVDGILYHTATPDDVAPNEWVFNDPVFLLLNVAIGGNFGGAIDPEIEIPQSMAVDYIRVYQGPDTAERFEASFADDFSGWQKVTVPFTDFARSADQPAGAPDDGLTLSDVWGYGFTLPDGGTDSGTTLIDHVRVQPVPAPEEITIDSSAADLEVALRDALATVADGGTVTIDSSLAGATIVLTSGQLTIDQSVTIDSSAAPGLTISGNNASRVFQIEAGATVSMNDLVITDGAGAPQGGGILNFGVLNLEQVAVTNNTEGSPAPADFQLGGGGIYNGDGATLNMNNSTVSNNQSINQPGGGIYGFFNSTINVTNSTISGNVSGDVAGGFRTLGDVNVTNSTISGNTSTAWHGGAMFVTDGTIVILNSTIVNNNGAGAGGLMVATFGAPVNVTVQNSIITDNNSYGCQVEGDPAVAVLTSLGNNLFSDGSCDAGGSDQVVASASFDSLADYGGPTETHALQPGSPAIDAADAAACPATDQRGVARDASCDIGAFEFVP